MKVGILRETKNPPDRRVPLTPGQIAKLRELYPDVGFIVQPSNIRCYSDNEYKCLGIPLEEDLNECDILLGIKEVDKETLITGKTYLFFAHVGKKQLHNREMLGEILNRKIRLIDYEYLKNEKGDRIVAFGRYAGIVGAYNGLRAIGIKKSQFSLKPANQCRDLEEMWAGLRLIEVNPGLKVLLTGHGRVANGAMETLKNCNLVKVEPEDFLQREFNAPVVCQIGPEHYVKHKKDHAFSLENFINHPEDYESSFLPFTRATDLLITGHYWDPRSPLFFTKDDIKKQDFRISVVADISCDLNGPVPTTTRITSITDPFYEYNPETDAEEPPFTRPANITVMAIDNLPGELPRNASDDFGRQLMGSVLNELFSGNESPLIRGATITRDGYLTRQFSYLKDYLIYRNL